MQSSSQLTTRTTDSDHPQQRHFGTELSQLQNSEEIEEVNLESDRKQLACFSGQKDQTASNRGSSATAKRSFHARSASIASFNEDGMGGGRTSGGHLGTFIENITEESEQQVQMTEREYHTSILAPNYGSQEETEEEFLASGNEHVPKSPSNNELDTFVQGQKNKSSSFPLTIEDLNVDRQRREIVKLIKENDYLQQRLRMQEAAIKSKDAELEELSEYFNSLQERYFRKQDECANKLSEDEFQMKELEFQLQMQREEMQLQIDVSNQQLASQRSDNERLHQEIASLQEQLATATATSSPREEVSSEDQGAPVLTEVLEEEEERQDCDETVDSQILDNEVTATTEGKKIESSEDDGKWVWVHQFALLAWASAILLIFLIALSKEF